MRLSDLRPAPGAAKKRKRIGRGPASGQGMTAGKGHKGQKARSGGGVRPGFEGGQMPLQRRVPKRGFSNYPFRRRFAIVNLDVLASLEGVTVVDPEILVERGLVKKRDQGAVKVLGDGELSRAIRVRAHAFSKSAKSKIEAAGGQVEVLA